MMKHEMVENSEELEWGQSGSRLLERPQIRLLLRGLLVLAGAWLLSGGVLPGNRAPFGLCAVAASGSGLMGMMALLGAALGSFFLPQPLPGLQYLSACVLCAAASLVFRGEGPCRRWVAPLLAALSDLSVGAIFLIGSEDFQTTVLWSIAEAMLVFLVTYLYGLLLHPIHTSRPSRTVETGQTVAILVFCATLILPLSRIPLPMDAQLGRAVAVSLVLLAGGYGGLPAGSVLGIVNGAVLAIMTGRIAEGLCFGLSGLVTGLLSGLPRWVTAAGLAVSHILLTPMLTGLPVGGALLEAGVAVALFYLLPEETLRRWGKRLKGEVLSPGHTEAMREALTSRLRGMGRAFDEAGSQAARALRRPPSREQRGDVFQVAADRVCRRCSQRQRCWERDAQTTYNVCNDMWERLLQRGHLEPEDFPGYFSLRCHALPRFTTAVNEAWTAGRYRRQFGLRLEESRTLLCQQYGEMARLLDDVAEEVREEMTFQPELEERAARFLRFKGIWGQAAVYRGRHQRLFVRIRGEDLSSLCHRVEETRRELSALLGVVLALPEQQMGPCEDRLLFREAEKIRLEVELAGSHKRGQQVSGDCGGYFRGEDGTAYVLLSDGMGSGQEAAHQSGMAVRLLERFLRAGVEPSAAIRLLNSSLVLGNREECTFVTVDLLQVDLYTGKAALFKCGAAPSYFRRGDRTQRIPCETLPVGADGPGDPEVTRVTLHLRPGDLLVLQSDGLEEDEPWVGEALRRRTGGQGLAQDLLARARNRGAQQDDMTAAAIQVLDGQEKIRPDEDHQPPARRRPV